MLKNETFKNNIEIMIFSLEQAHLITLLHIHLSQKKHDL